MFIVGNLFSAIAVVLNVVITLLWWLILIRALISWVNPDPYNPLVQFLHRTTEPLLAPLRRIVPAYNFGIDISPILAILILLFLQHFVVATLQGASIRLQTL